MQLIRDIYQLPYFDGSVVTDGMFDGVHLGHQQILKQLVQQSKELSIPSVVLTYWPHPRHVLSANQEKVALLSSLDEKAELIGHLGVDFMVVVPFTLDFSQMSYSRFVEEILVQGLRTKHLIIGYDHRFGQNRLGNIHTLKTAGIQFGFGITEIGKKEVEDIAVSSTKIRNSLSQFQPEAAQHFLGRPYSIRGRVVEGDKRGRTIGFPTANLEIDEPLKLIPKDGVYATRCRVDNTWYPAMSNLGFRPTVDGKKRSIETHLLEFDGDLYGKTIDLAFCAAIREEMKFEGLDGLKKQLEADKKKSWELLQEN
jgi:riboflavin kinase/FMN adenylyltransferase